MTRHSSLLIVLLALNLACEPAATTKGTKPVNTEKKSSAKSDAELPRFDKLWNFSKPDETEKAFRDLLPEAEAKGSMNYQLCLKTQIARTQGLQRKFDEAHATLDEVEAKLDDSTHEARIRYLLERGRAFNSAGQKDKARPVFLEAWNFGKAHDFGYFAVDAAHMLGIVDPPEQALAWNEKAMALAESSKDPRAANWLGALYNNTGWTYHDKKDYDKAMVLFEKCLAWHTERKNEGPILIGRWSIARCWRSQGKLDQALDEQHKLEKEREQLGKPGGYVFEELAELYLLKGDKDKAGAYFKKAYAILSKDGWLMDNEKARMERMKKLAADDS